MKLRPDERQLAEFIEKYNLLGHPLEKKTIERWRDLTDTTWNDFIPASELTKAPSTPAYLVKGLFLEGSVNLIFGPPASYKSFISLDIACCIAMGVPFGEREVAQGDVVYVVGEGLHGYGGRIRAWEVAHDKKIDNLYVTRRPFGLSDEEQIQHIINFVQAKCHRAKLIVIDTLARNWGDGDENSSTDFNLIMNNLDRIKLETGASILVIHHSGHGDSNRSRGSSAIQGAMDNVYKIERKDDIATMTCTKSKDFEEPQPIRFRRLEVDTGWRDGDGFPYMNVVMEEVGAFYNPSDNKLTPIQQRALTDLERLIQEEGSTLPNGLAELVQTEHPDEVLPERVISVEAWQSAFINNYIIDGKKEDSAARSFRSIRRGLHENEFIKIYKNCVWLS